ncbi:hypothetical protein GCM10025867_02010 [Frondihabitans sucicola]|uniref:Cardiolipin synthase N-terminal domain-containing protein n=1 Tax=Frondihabitans sucicola TaxID=1268041 RepID=A0ABN6XWD2_9MICO|nr:PLDc N-terminal domain-containing protein [Frondihabitans sucicola]BDZ47960.1 hypothetical protein GCM10025867_02010 [Frondihabitans sucicola]
MYLVISAFYFLLVIAALIDIITRDDSRVQHLPKLVWVLLVVLLPLIGSILWFAVGREYAAPREHVSFGDPRRHSPQVTVVDPGLQRIRTTEQELADLDREIEFYEKQAKLKRLQAEVGDPAIGPDGVMKRDALGTAE